jgi:hypothetical protein
MASTLPAHDRTIDTLRQKIRDAETRAAWNGAFRQPAAEQEARALALTLRHDLETVLNSRMAAARSIWALRKLGST